MINGGGNNNNDMINNNGDFDAVKNKVSYTNDDILIFGNVGPFPDAISKLIEIIESEDLAEKIEKFSDVKMRMLNMLSLWAEEHYKMSKLRKK